jgi:hypothetical protein
VISSSSTTSKTQNEVTCFVCIEGIKVNSRVNEVEKAIFFIIYIKNMEKLLGRKFNSREECVEAVFSACRNENFKSSIKNSKKGYQINFRYEFAEKAQKKKKAWSR